MTPLPSIRPSYPKPVQANSGRVWLPSQPRRKRSGLRQPPQLLNRNFAAARAGCSAAVRAAIAWLFMT